MTIYRALGLDVGNTRLKVHRLPATAPSQPSLLDWVQSSSVCSFLKTNPQDIVTKLSSKGWLPTGACHIITVDGLFAEALEAALHVNGTKTTRWSTASVPMKHPYKHAKDLGTDRLLAAWAAHRLMPHEDLIVIDAGTAITVDVVSAQGEFLGGAIAPGLPLLSGSLHEGTAQLQRVMPTGEETFPATSTKDACSLGVLAAFNGAIKELTNDAQSRFPLARMVATGGDHELVSSCLPDATAVVNLLTVGFALLDHQE